jgi:hypothetical protein
MPGTETLSQLVRPWFVVFFSCLKCLYRFSFRVEQYYRWSIIAYTALIQRFARTDLDSPNRVILGVDAFFGATFFERCLTGFIGD